MQGRGVLKKYYYLTKPGIIRGNIMTAGAGFLYASKGDVDWLLLLITLLATSLVIASGCVFNNVMDQSIDAKMARTKKRALVTGDISPIKALIFGTILGATGFFLLAQYVNWLTFAIGVIGIVDYVLLYGWSKRRSPAGTLVGSICGATAIAAGYTAATNSFTWPTLILFLIMVVWQMPHFYAIAVYRLKEYKAAKIPVLSVVKGIEVTKHYIVSYIVAFLPVTVSLWLFGYASWVYGVVMLAASLWWLYVALGSKYAHNSDKWAKSVFGSSLVVLLIFSTVVAINPWLP